MKTLKIGKIKLKNPIFLAPMVDVTDLAYRQICRGAGAAISYTEMIVVDSLLHENAPTLDKIKTNSKDSPIGIQITGDKLDKFKQAIPILKKFDLVDINCGCPSSRIQSNQAGSYLLKDPKKIAEIISLLKSAGLTVTAKIRLGYSKNEVIKIAKIIEEAGADALTIHARLASDGNDVPADWSWIAEVKKRSKIPIIGNGDALTPEKALEMLDICDGVMIARGAIGNPLIFKQTLSLLKKGKYEPASFKENISCFKNYLNLLKKYDLIDLPRIKYLGSKFIRNVSGGAAMRAKIMSCKSYEEITEYVSKIAISAN